MTRLDQPGQFQAGDRFAHHIAADAELRAELLLGGQPLARRKTLIEDARAQLLRDLVGKVFGTPEAVKRGHDPGFARRCYGRGNAHGGAATASQRLTARAIDG